MGWEQELVEVEEYVLPIGQIHKIACGDLLHLRQISQYIVDDLLEGLGEEEVGSNFFIFDLTTLYSCGIVNLD